MFSFFQGINFTIKISRVNWIYKIFCLSILLQFQLLSFSQRYYHHQLEVYGAYGATIPHRQSLHYLINQKVPAGGITYSLKTDGSRVWHHEWRFPELGLGYLASGLGNFTVFGRANSIYTFFGTPVIETDNLVFKYRFGLGAAHVSEKYDYRVNYYNTAIGSKLNAHIHFSVLANIMLFDTPLYFTLGTAFNHFSNASFKKPNLGLNVITLNAGAMYMISDHEYSIPKRVRPFMNREYYFTMYYGFGSRQNTTYEDKNHFVQTLVADASIKYNHRRSFGLGLDFVIDPSLQTQIKDSEEDFRGNKDLVRVGIHFVQDVFLTQELVCIFQIGTYAYNRHGERRIMMYNRLGIRYIINERLVGNFMIRSHAFVADFAELGIGYRFRI